MPGHRPSRWSNESNRQASALWNFTFSKRQKGGRKKEVNKYMPNDFVYRWLMKRVRQGQVESIWGCGERVDGFSVGDEEKSPGGSDLWTDGLMKRSIQLSKEVRPGCANQREQQVQRPQKKNELDVIEGGKKGQYAEWGEDEVRRLAESRLYLVLQMMVVTLVLFKERWRSQWRGVRIGAKRE